MSEEDKANALKMWAQGATPAQIATLLDLTVEEVSPMLARETYAAIDLALRGGGWK